MFHQQGLGSWRGCDARVECVAEVVEASLYSLTQPLDVLHHDEYFNLTKKVPKIKSIDSNDSITILNTLG